MVNFLYSEESLGKNMDFLKRNDYPSPVDRKLNQQYYGKANEFKNLANRLKTQTDNIINPKLPDATDRAFLSGLMGDEREELEYQKQLTNAKNAKADFAKAFNGSPFEGLFNTNVNTHNTVPIKNQGSFDVTSTVNRNPNRKLTPEHAINRNPNTSPTVTQYSNKQQPEMWYKNGEYAAANKKPQRNLHCQLEMQQKWQREVIMNMTYLLQD